MRLAVEADRAAIRASSADLSYLSITLTDAEGNLYTDRDRPVTVEIAGPGVLQGSGSARLRERLGGDPEHGPGVIRAAA